MYNAGSMKVSTMNSPSKLIFLYNKAEKKVLFHSLPFTPFFESVNIQMEPFFLNNFDNELLKQWVICLQLKEKESHDFSCKTLLTNGISVFFKFHVLGMSLPSPHYSSLLLFSIVKTIAKETAPDYRKDYAEFIDLAVHDMDAPLRKLSVLTERLTDKSKKNTIKDAENYISRIQANVADMRLIIESLSVLSKINLTIKEKNTCNTTNLLKEIAHKWEDRLNEKKIKLSVADLPGLFGDCNQIKQLFSCILDNAIKFSRESGGMINVKVADITHEEQILYGLLNPQTYTKIIVTDNGIGFRKEHAEKIFQPFVRLNGKTQYAGNGIGLAICKRIVEIHNGIIYAEGEENNGARIILILPQSPD